MPPSTTTDPAPPIPAHPCQAFVHSPTRRDIRNLPSLFFSILQSCSVLRSRFQGLEARQVCAPPEAYLEQLKVPPSTARSSYGCLRCRGWNLVSQTIHWSKILKTSKCRQEKRKCLSSELVRECFRWFVTATRPHHIILVREMACSFMDVPD